MTTSQIPAVESYEVKRLRELEIELPAIAKALDAKRFEIVEVNRKLKTELDELTVRWDAAQRERGDLI